MAHGTQDYGIGAPGSTIYIVQDLAELAARIGSVDTFDRRGNIIWMTNFEDGIHGWIKEANRPLSTLSWSAESARNGSFCMKVTMELPKISWVKASYRLPLLVFSRAGVEFGFDCHFGMTIFIIRHRLYDGTRIHEAGVEWNALGGTMWYWGTDECWHELEPAYPLKREAHLYHIAKLVIDPATGRYVRFILDNAFWDMKDLSYFRDTDPSRPCIIPSIEFTAEIGEAVVSYVNHAIITQNEP